MSKTHPTRAAFLFLPFVLPVAFGIDMYIPSLSAVGKALSVDITQIQLTLSIFMVCFGLGQLIIGPLSDKYGRKKILLSCLILFITGSIVCASSNTLTALLIGRILQALGACGSQVITFALVSDFYEGPEASQIFSYIKAGAAISPVIAPIVGSFLLVRYGWKVTFVVLSCYGALIFMLALRAIEEPQRKVATGSFLKNMVSSYKKIITNHTFLYFGLCTVLAQTAVFSYLSFSPRFYMNQFHLSPKQFAYLFSANSVVYLLTGFILGKHVYKIGLKNCTLIAACLLLVSGFSMYLSDMYYEHYWVLFIPNLFASCAAVFLTCASISGALAPFKGNAGAAAAVLGCLEFMGGGLIGTLIIGSSDGTTIVPMVSCVVGLGLTVIMVNVILHFRKILI